MNLVLIGYRGTGKSAVGRIVAKRLGLRYVSMDAAIIEKARMTVPQIVQALGWPGFRDLESEQARILATQDNLVIDTGGGLIERPENIAVLKATALIVWLKASVEVIVARIQTDSQRPALTPGKTFTEEIAEVLAQRLERYRAAAQFEIDTDRLAVAQVADRVADIWRLHRGDSE
ncbi:MAG: shikimate kinase [Desulfobacteraceae bacterium]|nr:MAG: shikimate kinase [Desulfobacteraceae bacterium]